MATLRHLLVLVLIPLTAGCFGTAGEGSISLSTRTLYVDQSNTTGIADGSVNNPFLTIADALAEANPGNTVHVRAGSYAEPVFITKPVRLEGDSAATTAIVSDGRSPVIEIEADTEIGVGISNLTLTGGLHFKGGAVYANGTDVELSDCVITLNATGNQGGNSEAGNASAVYLQASNGTIERCAIIDNGSSGIGGAISGTILVRNTIVAVTGDHGIHIRGDDSTLVPDLVLENVTVYGSAGNSIVTDAFANSEIANVICSAADQRSFREGDTSGDPVLRYNDLEDGYRDADTDSNTSDPDVINSLRPPGSNTGNIVADPQFVDPTGGDFRLQPTSPCVNTGDPGRRDPDGTRSDMGAYGGPGADLNLGFNLGLDIGDGLAGFFQSAVPVERLRALLNDPVAVGSAAAPLATDLDADGYPDLLAAPGQQLHWQRGTPNGGGRPGLLPCGRRDVQRFTVYDLDGDDRLDLVLEGRDGLRAWVNRRPFCRTARVGVLAGDVIEVRTRGAPPNPPTRVASGRGDQDSGRHLVALPRGAAVSVRVLRGQQVVASWSDVQVGETRDAPGFRERRTAEGSQHR